MKVLSRTGAHPTQVIAGSFLAVIVTATVLLALPVASASGKSVGVVNAFFTATSATCVTGLVVVDTGSAYSLFGQLVILACIQIGGLGLMSFTTIFMVMLQKRLAVVNRLAMQESLQADTPEKIRRLLVWMIVSTFTVEGVAALILGVYWYAQGRFESLATALYHGLFHAVSAFCNAGFGLYPDSLIRFAADPLVVFLISGLVFTGGIGFVVLLDVMHWLRIHHRRRRHTDTRSNPPLAPRLAVHTRLVLITTGALLVIGAVSYFVLEREGVFAGMSSGQAWMNSWFASVTARTAGFNTVDYASMGGATLLCTMVLMFIGGSPGSTAGGIKTSTFALLLVYSYARWRGHQHVHAFGRTLPEESRDRAAFVVVASIALVILGASVLMASETFRGDPHATQHAFLPILFETISAFGTVGLSLGSTTAQLSDFGKVTVAVIMFMGRVGPLTLALAVSRREKETSFRYAEENIIVG